MLDQKVSRTAGNVVSFILHSVNAIWIFYVLLACEIKDNRVRTMFRHIHIYLTVWNMTFQMVYFAANIICHIEEMLNIINNKRLIKYMRVWNDIFFDCYVSPITLTVGAIFWPLFLVNREIIFPLFIDGDIGAWPNYIMHGFIVPAILWDIKYQTRAKPTTHKLNLYLLFILCVLYVSVIFYTNSVSGIWPYPFLDYFDGTVYLHIIILGACLLTFVCYYAQWPLRRYFCDIHNKNKNV